MLHNMPKHLIAKVYVEKAVYHIDRPYNYLVPDSMSETLTRGCRVLVPFGGSNKKAQGIVYDMIENQECERQLKAVYLQLDKLPILTDDMFSIIEFLVKNTFCSHYDAVKCVLPTGKNVDIIETYRLTKSIDDALLATLSQNEQRVVEFLRTAKTAKELNSFLDYTKNPANKAVVKALLDKGIVEKIDRQKQKVAKKTVRMVKLVDGFEPQNTKLTPKQKEVVSMLFDVGVAMTKELAYLCGVTEGVIKTLEKKQILEFYEREIETTYEQIEPQFIGLDEVVLSKTQFDAYNGIMGLIDQKTPNVALLYGVTGSGKTSVYIKLIESVIIKNKTAMLLVPEIALTSQLVAKFETLFGGIIAVIHSSLSLSERLEEYNRIKAGQVKIVIGTRSAVFAPLLNIGLIIMDEEGESSYKSDAPPRYHTREIAKLICVNHNATLLLGSATPSIDSYYHASSGKYSLFELAERYADAVLPSVYIVDMLEEQSKQNFSCISEILGQQIRQNIDKNEQSILLINRRGYNTFATCMQCDEVVKCPSCDVSMTYHKANGYMMCHYCGHTEKFNSKCKCCNGDYIKLTGVGTQKLEDEINSIFPKARVLRMDTDTTFSKNSYEKNFNDFRAGKYDIMLGTQMIAKGLDFPNVTLVGVINADSGLYSTDFKASERVFSLITQVVGRSGRSEKSGRAYIQTIKPDNPIINFAANQDYKGFYEDEIFSRKAMTYPPFCDIVVLGFSGENEKSVEIAAIKAISILKQEAQNADKIVMKVMGVTRASIYKISNKYRYRIIIKCRLNNNLKAVISNTLKKCGSDKQFNRISCFADVNGDIS
ncbi:MAG: primosomal protein N' [Oscillospiraceae bacterium]